MQSYEALRRCWDCGTYGVRLLNSGGGARDARAPASEKLPTTWCKSWHRRPKTGRHIDRTAVSVRHRRRGGYLRRRKRSPGWKTCGKLVHVQNLLEGVHFATRLSLD